MYIHVYIYIYIYIIIIIISLSLSIYIYIYIYTYIHFFVYRCIIIIIWRSPPRKKDPGRDARRCQRIIIIITNHYHYEQ